MTFDIFMTWTNLLPYTFLWEKCWEFIFWTSIIQLNRNLMMSIRALSRHKLAKWADRKAKMAITAAILKISFWHFPNFWSPWAETCSVATGWLLDRNELKLCRSEIQDDQNDSPPLNKVATRAKNRKSSFCPWPVAWFQNICTEVFELQFLQWPYTKIAKMVLLGWIEWQPELKLEKPLKDISSAVNVLISK